MISKPHAQRIISFKAVCFPLLLISAFLLITLPGLAQPEVGEVLPGWTEGTLDIHHINTGKGESVFLILPDATTMLVDAGATRRPKPRVTDAKPDDSRTPGEWIARYIMHFMEEWPNIYLSGNWWTAAGLMFFNTGPSALQSGMPQGFRTG